MVNEASGSILGSLWKIVKVPLQWFIKKTCEDWIRLIIKEAVNEEKERIISSSITVQKLQAYDAVHDEFSKSISYAIGRCFEYHNAPEKYDEIHVMKQVNEVRQTSDRFLRVCGPKIKSLLLEAGAAWFKDAESFLEKAYEIHDRVRELVSEDRQFVEQGITNLRNDRHG